MSIYVRPFLSSRLVCVVVARIFARGWEATG